MKTRMLSFLHVLLLMLQILLNENKINNYHFIFKCTNLLYLTDSQSSGEKNNDKSLISIFKKITVYITNLHLKVLIEELIYTSNC